MAVPCYLYVVVVPYWLCEVGVEEFVGGSNGSYKRSRSILGLTYCELFLAIIIENQTSLPLLTQGIG